MKKRSLFGVALVACTLFLSGTAFAGPTYYTAIYQSSYPLAGYEKCGFRGFIGQDAYEVAANEANAQCEEDGNLDCNEVSIRFKEIISTEFIGFKACEAKVVVRGWK